MIAVIRKPRPGKVRRRMKPSPARFTATAFTLPESPRLHSQRNGLLLASLVAAGSLLGAWWPQDSGKQEPTAEIFVMGVDLPQPPPAPAPVPPMPEPPPPKAEEPPAHPPPPSRSPSGRRGAASISIPIPEKCWEGIPESGKRCGTSRTGTGGWAPARWEGR